MTRNRDLKRRIRERQARTHESYVTARRHVLAQRPPPAIPVVELVDLTSDAAALGFRCPVIGFPDVVERVGRAPLLPAIRDALLAHDQAILLRALAFANFAPPLVQHTPEFANLMPFLRQLRAGLGGLSPHGYLLGLHVGGVPIVCAAWHVHAAKPARLVIHYVTPEGGLWGVIAAP